LLHVLAQDFKSVGGGTGRPDISDAKLQISLNTIWSNKWWTRLDSVLSLDWTRDGISGMTVDGEVDYRFNSRWQAFLQYGAGLWGQGVAVGAVYDWQVISGVR